MTEKNVNRYKSLIHDFAETVSANEESADAFFEEEGINMKGFIDKGMNEINSILSKKQSPKKSSKKSSRSTNKNFQRYVLAAKIAEELHPEPTFGHVKFQKLVYLAEQIAEMEFSERYEKQAAGPFDRKFMHTIDLEFQRLKWFEVENTGKPYYKYVYYPLDNLKNYQKYYLNYFSKCDNQINWLIDTFRKKRTNDVELIATLYYCWDEIIKTEKIFSEDLLIKKFFAWSKEKSKKFVKSDVLSGIGWMKKENFHPVS